MAVGDVQVFVKPEQSAWHSRMLEGTSAWGWIVTAEGAEVGFYNQIGGFFLAAGEAEGIRVESLDVTEYPLLKHLETLELCLLCYLFSLSSAET